MMRKLALALALSCMATLAYALGLGNLQLDSHLNEPFGGKIELIGATVDELDSLTATLASIEEFQRAGLERPFLLSKLKFRLVRNENGPDYIRVSSHDPIKEPYLDFLLEVNWATGRFIREYTVLLDPPIYDTSARNVSESPGFTNIVDKQVVVEHEVQYVEATESTVSTYVPPAPASGTTSGGDIQVGKRDTLWSLASANLPDTGISVQQMMLALLSSNPEAFQQDNINTLKAGYVLRVPDRSEITSLSRGDAMAEVKRHHARWQEYRMGQAQSAPIRPEGITTPSSTSSGVEASSDYDNEARLELVAPSAEDIMDETEAGSALVGSGVSADLEDEQIETTLQENEDLQGKLSDADDIISLLERKIQLQNDELAAVQEVLANQDYEQEVVIREDEYPGFELIPGETPSWKIMEHDVSGPGDSGDMMERTDLEQTELAEWQVAEHQVTEIPDDPEAEEMAIEEMVEETGEEAPFESTISDAIEEPIEVMEEVELPVKQGGILDSVTAIVAGLVPASILAMLPGGALAILGIVALVLVILVLVVIKLVKGRAETVVIPDSAVVKEEDLSSEEETVVASSEENESDDFLNDVDDTPTEQADMGMDTITDLQATLAAEEATAGDMEEEEDPLEEVNVYLAYERFDQAAEVVKKAIADNPEEDKFKLRLLEVYYSANNKAGYETTAKDLHDSVNGEGPLWDSAVTMWTEMSPERELFAEGSEPEVDADDTTGSGGFVDLTAEEDKPDTGLDFDLDLETDGTDTLDITGSGEIPADDDILDLTGEISDASDDDVLDLTAVDDGMDEALSMTADEQVTDDELLEMTAIDDDGEEILDLTGSGSDDELLDLTAGNSEDDDELFDLTAPSTADDLLDITGADDGALDISDGLDEDPLDVTAAPESKTVMEESSLLDITSSGDASLDLGELTQDGEDLLDVTSVSEVSDELGLHEESADSSSGESLEFDIEDLSDDNSLDFDLGDDEPSEIEGLELAPETDELTDSDGDGDDENVLDFELGGDDSDEADGLNLDDAEAEGGLELDIEASDDGLDFELGGDDSDEPDGLNLDDAEADGGLELDIGSSDDGLDFELGEEDLEGLSLDDAEEALDFDMGLDLESSVEDDILEKTSSGESSDVSLDLGSDSDEDSIILDEDDSDLEFDLGDIGSDESEELDLSDDGDFDLNLDDDSLDASLDELAESLGDTVQMEPEDSPSTIEKAVGGLDLEIEGDEELALSNDDMLSTVEYDGNSEDETSETEQTIVMPRNELYDEQSVEDEIDTKLNLAKAYIELGDKDGAKAILDEVTAAGDDQQQQDAQGLLKQLD